MTNITPKPLSPTDQIYPPGKPMKPKTINKITTKKTVSFPENTSPIPFSPIVQATLMKDGTFQVRAVFMVAHKQDELDFKIYQNWYIDIEGQRQLQFFIAYDILDDPETEFDVYETSFKAEPYPYGKDTFANITTIQTFLWDIDPETSRGTVTTVQQGT